MSLANVVNGTTGNDRLSGTAGTDLISANLGDDLLLGGGGNDILTGGPSVSQPGFESDQDRLFGGRGNDVLIGNRDDDVRTGGVGRDVFVLGTHNLSVYWDTAPDYSGGGQDIVSDFTKGTDRIAVLITRSDDDYSDDPSNLPFVFGLRQEQERHP